MSTASDKLKALLAKKSAAKAVVPFHQPSAPVTKEDTVNKIAALRKKAAGIAEAKSKVIGKSSTKKLVPMPAKKLVPETTTTAIQEDTAAQGVLAKFNATDEMHQIDGFNADIFMDNLESLSDSIIAKAPNIGEYLHLIHRNLSKYPELTHLLEDEQIGIVVSGLLKLTNTELAIKATKVKGTKKSAPISIDMAQALF